MLKIILPQDKLLFLKVNSGPSHMTCLPRRDSSSEALVKETCLFHSRDGTILTLLITVQQSGSNNYSDNPQSYSDDVLVDLGWAWACHVYFLSNTMGSQLMVV